MHHLPKEFMTDLILPSQFKIKIVYSRRDVFANSISLTRVRELLGDADATRVSLLARIGGIKSCKWMRSSKDIYGKLYVNPFNMIGLKSPMRAALRLRLIACIQDRVTDKMIEESALSYKRSSVKKEVAKSDPFVRPVEAASDASVATFVAELQVPLATPEAAEAAEVGKFRSERLTLSLEQLSASMAEMTKVQVETLAALKRLNPGNP
jgi:hypothetical protein